MKKTQWLFEQPNILLITIHLGFKKDFSCLLKIGHILDTRWFEKSNKTSLTWYTIHGHNSELWTAVALKRLILQNCAYGTF